MEAKKQAKKETARGQAGRSKNNVNGTIQHLCDNSKYPIAKTAVLTRKTHKINGYATRLLEICPNSFRIEKRGLKQGVRHASGVFFRLDRLNFRAAKQFLCSEVAA